MAPAVKTRILVDVVDLKTGNVLASIKGFDGPEPPQTIHVAGRYTRVVVIGLGLDRRSRRGRAMVADVIGDTRGPWGALRLIGDLRRLVVLLAVEPRRMKWLLVAARLIFGDGQCSLI